MNTTSILMKRVVEPLLNLARENLERDGFLVPVLMADLVSTSPLVLMTSAQAPLIVMLKDVPNTPEQRHAYFAEMGAEFRSLGQTVRAAVSLMESWMVQAHQAPAVHRIRPSQHPSRQEVLALVGRDAENTRTTQVIQPFTRTATNQLVWSEPVIAIYNEPVTQGYHAQSLLDALFLGNQAEQGSS